MIMIQSMRVSVMGIRGEAKGARNAGGRLVAGEAESETSAWDGRSHDTGE